MWLQGRLLAAIGSRIHIFTWALGEDGTRSLELHCAHHAGNILALYVDTCEDSILVGTSWLACLVSLSILCSLSMFGDDAVHTPARTPSPWVHVWRMPALACVHSAQLWQFAHKGRSAHPVSQSIHHHGEQQQHNVTCCAVRHLQMYGCGDHVICMHADFEESPGLPSQL